MYYGWIVEAIDVEAAFWNADVDDDIYIEPPEGLTEINQNTHICKLIKAMYRIVQAPRCWSKTFAKCITSKICITKIEIDPMLFFCHKNYGQIEALLANYVDDGIIYGTRNAVD